MSLARSPASSESAALTDSRLAALCAGTVHRAFLDYDKHFHAITLRARERFLGRDWGKSYADAAERLHLYGRKMEVLTKQIKEIMGLRLRERTVWTAMKAVYSLLIAPSGTREIAESFFNSLTRRVFATEGVDQAIEFVDTDFDAPPNAHGAELCRTYAGAPLAFLLREALTDANGAGFALDGWSDLNHASKAAADRILVAI